MNARHLTCAALVAASLFAACATPNPAPQTVEPETTEDERVVTPPKTEPPERVETLLDPAAAIDTAQSAVVEAEDDAYWEATPDASLEDLTIAFTPADFELVKEPRPKVDSKGCASGFDAYFAAFEVNNKAYEYRAADKNGWRRLANVRTNEMGPRSSEPAQLPKGTEWKVVGVTGCGPTPEFYIDEDHNVFQVYPENGGCSRTTELKLCGVWGIRGCGRQPPEYSIEALVPADAEVLQHPRSVKLPNRRCYRPNPTGGISRPG